MLAVVAGSLALPELTDSPSGMVPRRAAGQAAADYRSQDQEQGAGAGAESVAVAVAGAVAGAGSGSGSGTDYMDW